MGVLQAAPAGLEAVEGVDETCICAMALARAAELAARILTSCAERARCSVSRISRRLGAGDAEDCAGTFAHGAGFGFATEVLDWGAGDDESDSVVFLGVPDSAS